MASAQEFSSPGAHMASNSGSGGVTSSGTIWSPGTRVGPGRSDSGSSVGSRSIDNGSDSVIFNDREPVDPYAYVDYSNINKNFEDLMERIGGFGSSGKDYSDYIDDFFDEHKHYNDEMFNRAKEYDEYMSNTAIQRQVEDLKKAGLNPILASHLGGASYNGVNPPYIQVNPSGALGALTGLAGTKYSSDLSYLSNTDVAKIHTSSNEFLTQFNRMQDFLLQDDQQSFEEGMIKLKRDADEFLLNLKYVKDKDLAKYGYQNQHKLNSQIAGLNRTFNQWFYSKSSNYYKIMDRENLWKSFQAIAPTAMSIGYSAFQNASLGNTNPIGFNTGF